MPEELEWVLGGKEDNLAAGEVVAIAVACGLSLPASVLGPLDLAPLLFEASDCFSVRIIQLRFESIMRVLGLCPYVVVFERKIGV